MKKVVGYNILLGDKLDTFLYLGVRSKTLRNSSGLWKTFSLDGKNCSARKTYFGYEVRRKFSSALYAGFIGVFALLLSTSQTFLFKSFLLNNRSGSFATILLLLPYY